MTSMTIGSANRNAHTTISGRSPLAVVNGPVLGVRGRRTVTTRGHLLPVRRGARMSARPLDSSGSLVVVSTVDTAEVDIAEAAADDATHCV
jgi:hypothetical protein